MSDEKLTWDELMKRKGVTGAKPNPPEPEPVVEPVPTPASPPAVSANPAAPTSSVPPRDRFPDHLNDEEEKALAAGGSTAPTKEQEHAAEAFTSAGSHVKSREPGTDPLSSAGVTDPLSSAGKHMPSQPDAGTHAKPHKHK